MFLLDPHPRKPHMFMWVQIDPADDYFVCAEGELDGDPAELWKRVREIEEMFQLQVRMRLIDPNMGLSPAGPKRNVTWQDEFAEAGLRCDLADDSDVGRGRVNEYLQPDPYTYRPRLHIAERCVQTRIDPQHESP